MSEQDRLNWDRRYRDGAQPDEPDLPSTFGSFRHLFPLVGRALDIACGRGAAAVWLALQGMEVVGVDISPVAIGLADELASRCGVAERCRFEVHDLDLGLPDTPRMDLILCHKFRDARLDRALIDRLAAGGVIAIAALGRRDDEQNRYRVAPGELAEAFADLDVLAAGEEEGVSWLIGRKPG